MTGKEKALKGTDGAQAPGMTFWKAYSKVARFEYLPAEILLILIPVLLVVKTPSDIFNLSFLEALTVFFLLYFTGFMANALSDREVDQGYKSYKSRIAGAVDRIGITRLKVLLSSHVLVAVILTLHLFVMSQNILVLILVSLGLFFGIGYSIRPFNFKTRGLAHGIALASSAFFLPLAFLMVVLAGSLNFTSLLFITGFTMAMYSLEFGNQAMDYYEDKEAGITTPLVRYNIKDSLMFALILLPFGLLLTTISMVDLSITKFKDIYPPAADGLIILTVTIFLCAGFARPAAGLVRIFRSVSKEGERKGVLKALKQVDHPSWQASGALGVVFVSCIIFGSVFFSFSIPKQEGPIQNKAPVVNIIYNPMIVNVGEPVEFEAYVMDDGEIVSSWWDFGDGTGDVGKNTTHIFKIDRTDKVPKAHTVRFTATDDGGLKSYDFINITVTKLCFSKLEFTAKRYLTYIHVDYEFNVTNDKDLKHSDELVVRVYYQGLPYQTIGLNHELDSAKIWNRLNGFDIALVPDPVFEVVLLHIVDDVEEVVEAQTVQAESN